MLSEELKKASELFARGALMASQFEQRVELLERQRREAAELGADLVHAASAVLSVFGRPELADSPRRAEALQALRDAMNNYTDNVAPPDDDVPEWEFPNVEQRTAPSTPQAQAFAEGVCKVARPAIPPPAKSVSERAKDYAAGKAFGLLVRLGWAPWPQ